MKKPVIITIVFLLIGLLTATACKTDGSETHMPIPVKDMGHLLAEEPAPDDIMPAPGGSLYRANIQHEDVYNPWPPIEGTEIAVGSGSNTANIVYRDYIETKAGEPRNNIIQVKIPSKEVKSLSLYTMDIPYGISLTVDKIWSGIPGTQEAVLVIAITPDVAPGEYPLEIGLEINGKDYGTIPCTINVIAKEARSQETFSTNEPSSSNESVWKSFTAGDTILGLVVTESDLWATTSSGIIRWALETGNYRKYTTQDGLGSDKVREIIRDSQGNIWVTCYVSGVSRFDGDNWESFNASNGLCSNETITLAADKQGGVWVSAYWGVSYFDGKQWSSYSNVDPNGHVVGGPNPMKDCQNLTFVDAELSAVDVIFVDSRGDVWFSDRGQGVTRFDGKDWHMFTVEDGLAKGGVSAIMEDKDGILWFGSNSGGITCFAGKNFTSFTISHYQSVVPRPVVMDIIQDSQDDIWAAAHDAGVVRFDGNNWQTFLAKDGLPSDNAQDLFLDKNGYPGVITDKGVSLFDGSTWQVLTVADGLPQGKVRVVVNDGKGNLWFGAEGGVSYYRK